MSAVLSFQREGLAFRPFTVEDAPDLHAYLNHPGLAGRRYLPWDFSNDLPLSLKQVEKVIEKWLEEEDTITFAVVSREGELIGHAHADWGWDPHMPDFCLVISSEHQRKGYGIQTLDLILSYYFQQTIAHNVSTWVSDWNEPGIKFLESQGFSRVGEIRRDGFSGGKFFNSIIYDILRPEWQQRKGD